MIQGAGADPLGWGCCQYRGGRTKCPANYPIMCESNDKVLDQVVQHSNNFDCVATASQCAADGAGGAKDRQFGCKNPPCDSGGQKLFLGPRIHLYTKSPWKFSQGPE